MIDPLDGQQMGLTVTRSVLPLLCVAPLACALCASPATAQQTALAAPGQRAAQTLAPARGCATVARMATSRGEVVIIAADGTEARPEPGAPLCAGDRVRTGPDGQAALRFDGYDTTVRLNVDTTLVINATPGTGGNVSLVDGVMRFLSSVRSAFTVRTALYSMTIEGTEVFVAADGDGALTVVEEGSVRFSTGAVAADGEAVFAGAGQSLAPATRDTVPPAYHRYLSVEGTTDWAISYPPAAFAGDDPRLARAAEALRRGDPEGALADLSLPEPGAARQEDAAALALASITELSRGDRAAARALADRAAAADPRSPAALTAEGYALQAEGDLDGAERAARAAAEAAPDDPIVLARLAEVALLRGDLRAGRDAADRSLAAGDTAYGHAVSGFADLAAYRDGSAKEAFARALEIDPGFPLARLGQAFAEIADGSLETGRAELETLATLDPRSARVRTLLGRAYFEEGLTDKARAQFRRAEEFDPDDPTPHLYAAQELFAANRPAAALRELEAADAKGANRAPVRGTRGLQEDDSRRGAAEGRIYETLGFNQLSVVAATRAARTDPTGVDAHRFLAEAYRGRLQYGPARTSEMLQSVLFSGPSKTPVQPQLGEADLSLLAATGAARVTFEEFTPLFDRDGVRVDLSGALGTQSLWGDEAAVTVLQGPVSLSVGQMHFETEGSDENDDVSHDIYSAQLHAQVTPELTLFGEYRLRETDEGERFVYLVPAPTGNRFSFTDNRARIGARLTPDADTEYVALGSWREIDGQQFLEFGTADSDTDGWDVQLRHDRRIGDVSLSVGGAYATTELEFAETRTFPFTIVTPGGVDNDYASVWGYGRWSPTPWMTATLGGAAHWMDLDDRQGGGFDDVIFAPKAGLEVGLGGGAVMRAAYARNLKRPLLFDETLEPTQVAGFNQVYAELNGTVSDMVGLGVDWQATDRLWFGAEAQLRWLDVPEVNVDPSQLPPLRWYVKSDAEVTNLRGYASFIIDDDWSAGLAFEYERYEFDGTLPEDTLDTFLVPATVRWNHGSGFFAGLDVTAFTQRTRGGGGDGSDDGVIVDAAVGYRLPAQRGILSLEALNIFDSDFSYQDSFGRTEDYKPRRLSRDFAVIARAAFRF